MLHFPSDSTHTLSVPHTHFSKLMSLSRYPVCKSLLLFLSLCHKHPPHLQLHSFKSDSEPTEIVLLGADLSNEVKAFISFSPLASERKPPPLAQWKRTQVWKQLQLVYVCISDISVTKLLEKRQMSVLSMGIKYYFIGFTFHILQHKATMLARCIHRL